MARVSGIYVIQNTKNGKVYIGQAQDFRKRWNEHRRLLDYGTHKSRHLQAAWNKYSAKAFRFYVLEYCALEMLTEREQHFIDIYKPKGMCYNIAGDVKAPMRGVRHSDEARRKISEANKGKTRTSETRRKLSEAQKRKPSISSETRRKISEANKGHVTTNETRHKISEANKGKTHTEEARRKMSEARKGIVFTDEQRRKLSEAQTRRQARQRAEREALATAQSEGLTP